MSLGLVHLPIELIYEIHIAAAEPTLPLSCAHLYHALKQAPTSVVARYLLSCVYSNNRPSRMITRALRYPICTPHVLDAFLRIPGLPPESRIEPPRRLFRVLSPSGFQQSSSALALLRPFCAPDGPGIAADAHEGYALARSVYASSVPLIRLLLDQGADPSAKGALSVLIAIRGRKLELVRMLIERNYTTPSERSSKRRRLVKAGEPVAIREPPPELPTNALEVPCQSISPGNKKRKLGDRVVVTPAMLRAAVEVDAGDIVDWLWREKGCKPDMQTLRLLGGGRGAVSSSTNSSDKKRSRARH